MLDLLDRALDQLRRFLRGVGAALCQIADFFGDDSKALAVHARACRLDCRIERQKVGLERDFIDGFDDLGYLTGRLVDLCHGGQHFFHLAVAGICLGAGIGRELIGQGCVVRILPGLAADFVHGSRYLLQ